MIAAANLAVRFILEISGVVALGYWGFGASSTTALRVALGVGTPVVLVIAWGFVVAPGAANPRSQVVRMTVGTILLEVTAAALFLSGQSALAVGYAIVVLANAVAMVFLGK